MAYFDSFPTGEYSNTQCVDLTRRVALTRALVGDPRVYLPYEVKSGERADQVAQNYYGSPDHTWMVYMSAVLTDPYHEWYLDQNSFDAHINAKYGSQELAIEATECYQLDWSADERELSTSAYAALDPTQKKYWEAVYGAGASVLAYTRRQEDWTRSTNMVVRLDISASSNAQFQDGDVVDVTGPGLNGQAEVAWANSTVVKVHHVRADVGIGQVITARSGANAAVVDVTYVSNTIPIDERSYWTRVSKYDYEYGRNEGRKFVRLVDRKYTNQLVNDLKTVLKQRPSI
jgi:hypothetical protein